MWHDIMGKYCLKDIKFIRIRKAIHSASGHDVRTNGSFCIGMGTYSMFCPVKGGGSYTHLLNRHGGLQLIKYLFG